MGFLDIFKVSQIKAENETLKRDIQNIINNSQLQISDMQRLVNELGVTEYYQTKEMLDRLNEEMEENSSINVQTLLSIDEKMLQTDKLDSTIKAQEKKLFKTKESYKRMNYAINNFFEADVLISDCKIPSAEFEELELISPSVILKLHCMDIKDLRRAFNDNEKQINKLLQQYSIRYTTKANKSIYALMVIALRAELQNILYNLKYEKLDKSVDDIKKVSAKYLKVVADGNQSIAVTITKFIGEIEYLFINAVKIEYNYYVKKEQAKQEQLAIREQMRQEAEERKALENERKKIEKEEEKYTTEINKLTELIGTAQDEELVKLNMRILELQSQLSDVIVKKEDITKLQNGKAGNVYIISNLGSFGENVFKVGMTRRLDPQDRVNELGDASVPFRFDVHSFIFSDNAVDLEKKLHNTLNDKRLNKVNLRKEFFCTNIIELEQLVNEIEPTAEFNTTMLAEEFRQSLSSDDVYSSNYKYEDDDDEAIE